MNTFKKTGGFTLVELIIVIAILAILSSVAVAGYSTYIKSANNSAAESFLNEVKTHVVLANAKAGNVGNIEVVAKDSKTLTVKVYVATNGSFASDLKTNLESAYGTTINVKNNAVVDATTGKVTKAATEYTFELPAPTAWGNSKYATNGAHLLADTTKWEAGLVPAGE